MKATKSSYTFLVIILAWLTASLFPATAVQATTYNIPSGQTTVTFSPQFFNLIPALGATASKISPAKTKGSLNKQNLRAIFPIATGALDNTGNRAQIGHKGGLTLTTGTNVKVQFTGFSLDFGLPTNSTRVMTALIVVNGSIVGRLPVFILGTNDIAGSVKGKTATLNNVPLTMSKQAADALNIIFGLPGPGGGRFYEGFPAGTLNLKATGLKDLAKM
jgi:hypothetical protein